MPTYTNGKAKQGAAVKKDDDGSDLSETSDIEPLEDDDEE